MEKIHLSWLQFSMQTDKSHAEHIEQALAAAGALSVTVTDAADQPLLEPGPGETPLWEQIIMTGLFPADVDQAALLGQISQSTGIDSPHIRIEALQEQEWSRTWMDYFEPMSFGQRLWVCPHEYPPPVADAVNLRLDPGLAFGTGTHPTTALCLTWLDGQDLQGSRILDYGCGSGILAIAAILLGATSAWAVDNDEQALIATRDNAANNQVSQQIHTCLPDALPAIQVEVCVANILAGPLCSLATRLAQTVCDDGQIILSGILLEQADEVRECYRPWFDFGATVSKDGWVLLQGKRKPGTADRSGYMP
jgi:ribosomal protein L11 methyltransferase